MEKLANYGRSYMSKQFDKLSEHLNKFADLEDQFEKELFKA